MIFSSVNKAKPHEANTSKYDKDVIVVIQLRITASRTDIKQG